MATSGPGAIHLLNGLYDANLDHQPVVAIVGQQSLTSIGGRYQQELDLQTLLKDVAGSFIQMATEPAQVRHLVDRAFRIALEERSVTCVIVPNDIQRQEAVAAHVHGCLSTRKSSSEHSARATPMRRKYVTNWALEGYELEN